MSNRGGRDRDRSRRDYPSRYEDNKGNGGSGRGGSSSNSGGNPPSRHLWVGNLPHNIVEDELAHPFIRFGPLEKVAFQPGRSYAFINFEVDEDAIDAMRSLQGFPLAGNPLRIEFAKADKPSAVTRDEDYSRDERRPAIRGSPFPQREFRGRHGSPEPHYSDKSKLSDKNPEPSEVLWIGFPAQLKVDESILDRAFSPFGEIVKISTFPGRSYAFVRYRNQTSACRAIDALKGKLFGNPRVHICFAKSESGSSSSGKSSFNGPRSPSYKSSGRGGSSENFRQDWSFGGEQNISSPNMLGNWDSRDSDFNNRGSSWAGGAHAYEPRKVGEKGGPLGVSQEFYEHKNSPSRERHFLQGDFPQNYPQRGPFFEDPHGLPEDAPYLHVAKKLKSGSSPSDRELPEYAFSELERQKHVFPRPLPDFPHREAFDKSFDAGNFNYGQTFNHPPSSPLVRMDRHDGWKPYDSFQMGPGALQSNFIEKKRFTPEPDHSSSSEWKWEGTIAKGGTPICRARCFPVGKVLDIALPEFLDCTARTSLDMLSKHYYQAVGVWVVFFVPGSDADIEFYNEFMHYLEEKQRAAVSKVDDKTTLFLVPPSEFSEKVLKVPGKLSISGVILRLEYPGLNQGSMHIEREMKNENLPNMYPNSSFPSARMPTNPPSISELGNSGIRSNLSFHGNKFPAAPLVSNSAHYEAGISESYDGRNHDYPSIQPQPSGPNWPPHNPHNFNSNRALPSHPFSGAVEPIAEERHPIMNVNTTQHSSGNSGIPFGGNSRSQHQEMRNFDPSTPVGSLQPEQLAQLAATLLEQQRHLGSSMSTSAVSDPRQNRFNESEASSRPSYAAENNLANSEFSTSQFGHHGLQLQKQQQQQQQQQQQMMPNAPQFSQAQRELPREVNGNQQLADHGLQEDGDADPQRRLQATLKLAATLLQQIHQEKGN
ncbi:flowering time control protein FPA-like [Vicia villosa]|uniref:flowering time control protein FPA-like n=1 Tax=Vicia villosa TaxID=3911 RepID=UPI00273B0BC0|nr:flowering time control protein FPA-like [Vicia villosa]